MADISIAGRSPHSVVERFDEYEALQHALEGEGYEVVITEAEMRDEKRAFPAAVILVAGTVIHILADTAAVGEVLRLVLSHVKTWKKRRPYEEKEIVIIYGPNEEVLSEVELEDKE